jgi:caspase domain-containing protein/sulfatase-modifying factor enzyme 1
MLRRVLLPIVILVGLVTSAAAEKRIALVVGNAAYLHVPRLDNPTNDARLMAQTLRSLGFTLVGGGAQVDLDKARFDQAVQDFGNQLLGADVALFYYAGHGVQVRGANYLVPLGANPSKEADVDFQMLDTNLVLRQMESSGAKLNIVILDACRNNPFGGRGLRATDSGLAQMRAPEGTLISFATQPGNVAQDGVGNSPYTRALAQTIKKPGLDVFSVFNEVGLEVMQSTGNSQQPWVSASPIKGRFYFAAPPAPVAAAPAITADEVFWLAIKDSKLEALFDEFVSKFPASPRASEARARLAELKKSQVAVAMPPVTPPAPPPVAVAPPAPSSDEVLWSVIKDSSVVASFEEFRRRFPTSPHAAEALARIEQLKKSQVAVVVPPVPPALPPAATPKPAVGIFNESGSAQPLAAERERSLKPKDSFRECDVCPEMVVVPAGAFIMGSPATEPSRDRSEGPEHRVTLARPFAVGKFAVSFEEWDACVADASCNGYRPPDEGWGRGRHPVLRVSWNDAKAYLRWLSRKTGKAYRC